MDLINDNMSELVQMFVWLESLNEDAGSAVEDRGHVSGRDTVQPHLVTNNVANFSSSLRGHWKTKDIKFEKI